jgi:hypothetical protein
MSDTGEGDMLDTAETVQPVRTQAIAVRAGSTPTAIVPTDLDQVWRIATMIKKSGMAPKDFDTPEKISVAIMHGLEIGLTPLQAMQRIAVINGRPSVWGEAVPGLALRTGQVEDWQERVDGEGELMVATCTVKRRGIRTPITKTFSVADAKTARLWGKAGPWQQYPKRMLQMRARVAFRDLFADAMGGLYIAEEVIGVEEPKDITPLPLPVSPPPGGQTELPPLAPQPTPGAAKPMEGEVLPPPAKAAKGKGKPLPPLAAQQTPSLQQGEPAAVTHSDVAATMVPATAAMSEAEAKQEMDRMLDQLDWCETMSTLAAWAANNSAAKNRLPTDLKAKVETAFNLKQSVLQKPQK